MTTANRVEKVSNQIEVLPLSPNDDRLRLVLYSSVHGHGALQTLAVRAVPPIHIIVENGNVTLEGVVGTELRKPVAGPQANSVSGVFSVTIISGWRARADTSSNGGGRRL